MGCWEAGKSGSVFLRGIPGDLLRGIRMGHLTGIPMGLPRGIRMGLLMGNLKDLLLGIPDFPCWLARPPQQRSVPEICRKENANKFSMVKQCKSYFNLLLFKSF